MDGPSKPKEKAKLRRFSEIDNQNEVPYFKYYSPKPDPVLKQEKRKMKKTEYPPKRAKIKMRCFTCKSKKPTPIKETPPEQKNEKYIAPLTEKQKRENEERHKAEQMQFFVCKKEVIRLPSPIDTREINEEKAKGLTYDSAHKEQDDRVVPDKLSLTESTFRFPELPTQEELEEGVPRSRIVVNRTKKKKEKKYPPVDSIDYIYDPKYRKQHPWYQMFRASDTMDMRPPYLIDQEAEMMRQAAIVAEEEQRANLKALLSTMEEEAEEEGGEQESDRDEIDVQSKVLDPHIKPRTSKLLESASFSDLSNEMNEGEGEGEEEMIELEKFSAATSIDSQYRIKYPHDISVDNVSLIPTVVNRILQKNPDSVIALQKKESVPYKRNTISSHSASKLTKLPKKFYFGVISGTMHYGDESFSESSRYLQGLPMCIVAYIFSFVRNPTKWNDQDINTILDIGDRLFRNSLENLHLHSTPRVLTTEELMDTVEISDKHIKYKIDDPEIAGFTKSSDPKIFNLMHGLQIFFARNRACILQTYNTNILIFKRKHFYVFDPEPRNQELYSTEEGVSTLANVYDIAAVTSMLLVRGKIENWPFILSKICIKKVLAKDRLDDGDSMTSAYREDSLFKIITPEKAIINASISINDNCFGECAGSQALAMCMIALVYNNITPSCAWHKKTLDKILRIGNQFNIECLKKAGIKELRLEHLPAFFTLGPLMIEVIIYANQYAGLMITKTTCLFRELLEKCFAENTSFLVDVDRFTIAIWRSNDIYYCFDPYARDIEGFFSKTGVACITMHSTLESLTKLVLVNFNKKDYIFKFHILKIIRITRDPEFGKIPRTYKDSETSIIESIKIADIRAFKPNTLTIDNTERAIRTTEIDETLEPSIKEIGSYVESIDKKFVPPINCPPRVDLKLMDDTVVQEKIIDLESASLSDTQIPKEQPRQIKDGSFDYTDIEELYRHEDEMIRMAMEGEDDYEGYTKFLKEIEEGEEKKLQDVIIQKGRDPGLIDRLSAQINTELLGLAVMPLVVLDPNKPQRKHRKRHPPQMPIVTPSEELITQNLELRKKSNYIQMPDGSQILYGSKNIAELGEDYNIAAPFVVSLAVVMERKYTLNTWSGNVVDSILDYGYAIFKQVGSMYQEIPKIIIPTITIGSMTYNVTIDYLFDSLLSQTILEESLLKLVFRTRTSAIIVTQFYSCAVFYKRKLYYMFDCFGCNLVGLGVGMDNSGVACMARFRTLTALVNRFLYNKKQREIAEPLETSRFVISTVDVKVVIPPQKELIPRRENQLPKTKGKHFESDPRKFKDNEDAEREEEAHENEKDYQAKEQKTENYVGFQKKGKYTVIEGSSGLVGRASGFGDIKECHFVSVCAMIAIFNRPIKDWDTKRVNYVVKIGKQLFGYVDNLNFADNRTINNLLIDKYFFDIIVKRINVADSTVRMKSFKKVFNYMVFKHKFLLIQFPKCCYVLYTDQKEFYLFDCYGLSADESKATWLLFKDRKKLFRYLKRKQTEDYSTFFFYTICICKFKKASKRCRLEYKLKAADVKIRRKPKLLHIFNEDEEWLEVYPVPWSAMKINVACGKLRGDPDVRWHCWDVEYPNDLYSLHATTFQGSVEFSRKTRNKQTIANCIVCIVMTEIYNFSEWNSELMTSILHIGNDYFLNTVDKIKKKNYEIKVEDFSTSLTVFPYIVEMEVYPVIQGTMYVIRVEQFNLSKALRYYFDLHENRCGIICCNNGTRTKYLAFGRIRFEEYFMYDCSSIGPPMFNDRISSRAYILRCKTLNRLIHIMSITLRFGDFFIYHVGLGPEQEDAEAVQKITEYDEYGGNKQNQTPSRGKSEITTKGSSRSQQSKPQTYISDFAEDIE